MKRNLTTLLLALFPVFCFCQNTDSLSTAREVDSLFQIYKAALKQSEFDKALSANDLAGKLILEKFGQETAAYGNNCFNAAYAFYLKGEYKTAEQLFLKSKNIREKVLGRLHPDYAMTLNNLANVYRYTGDYSSAELLYLEAMAILEKTVGKEHKEYGFAQSNLASLYATKGDYAKAEQMNLEVIAIKAKVVGKEHKSYAASLNNLANLYREMGYFSRAESLYLESASILAQKPGKTHPNYAAILNNLANLYRSTGNFSKAEPLFKEAIEIKSNALGKAHPDYALSLNDFGLLCQLNGDYVKSEQLYLEATAIYEKTFGSEHPESVAAIINLARLYHKTNRISEASAGYLKSTQLNRVLVERAATYSSENEMLAYLHTFNDEIAGFQSFSQSYPTPQLFGEVYNNALFYNGFVLENERLLARAISGSDSLTREVFEKWQSCHRRLAEQYARPISERTAVAELEAEAEGYEKTLMRSLPAFRVARKMPKWQAVQDRLRPGEVAIEFLHFPYYAPERTDSTLYAALLLRPGWDAPEMIPLFEEKALDSLLASTGERRADYVENIYSMPDRGVIADDEPAQSLYELLWYPLEKALQGVTRIYFSPGGLLHRLNLAAVPVSTDSTLADRYLLIELGSTRQLAANVEPTFNNNEAILFGGIRYEMDSLALTAAVVALDNSSIASRGEPDPVPGAGGVRGDSWRYLPGTDKEVAGIEKIISGSGMQVRTLKGYNATEEIFKRIGTNGLPSPRILHLATHGFFSPDPKDTLQSRQAFDERTVGFKASDNPLIRSGLLLAGANQAWTTGKPVRNGMENGILTAYEICHMDLSNTELVVLSACETGLGDIAGHEGVYGLQRAFKMAGAKYLIMSLWRVPDFQTHELMITFYTKWLTEKMTIPDAFHAAQKEMREKYQNPYYWAGFVLVE